jgi:Flp pilus assembly pilin Flp
VHGDDPIGGTCADARKKPRIPPLLAGISAMNSITDVKGGGTHHTIVRGLAAQEGQAMAEYAVILALVVAGAIAGYQLLGGAVLGLFNAVVTTFTS